MNWIGFHRAKPEIYQCNINFLLDIRLDSAEIKLNIILLYVICYMTYKRKHDIKGITFGTSNIKKHQKMWKHTWYLHRKIPLSTKTIYISIKSKRT